MNRYVIFGAGDIGAKVIDYIGEDNIDYYIDSNPAKWGTYNGYDVLSLDDALDKLNDSRIVIAVSDRYVDEIAELLHSRQIDNYITYRQLQMEKTREKILKRIDYIDIYRKAIDWIKNNSIPNEGIICNSALRKSYPEVSGYYIPTLIRWGYKDIALTYAKWLCSIQKEDGSWYDTEDELPYVFDSAQILKGLLAIRADYREADLSIIRGCEWLLSNMTQEGRLLAWDDSIWGDGKIYSELIHTYCISPIYEAGRIFNRADFIEGAERMIDYYTTKCRDEILDFGLLSHFYAYVMEAMLDIGKPELAREAMEKVAALQKDSGAVPAYKDVDWVCSTGLFQLAIVWFRLGDTERGNKAFEYACKLQNETGGWFGSYLSEVNATETNTYFPNEEISWAVKYFLDALYYKNLAQFEEQAHTFGEHISREDGRYQAVLSAIMSTSQCDGKVLDVGCGKGRYLRNLVQDVPDNTYYAVDLSCNVMKYFADMDIEEQKQGSLTNIPYPDDYFDVVYTCEALEHAIDVKRAVAELTRVTKKGGKIVILDKNKDMLGYFEIEEWEQWFDEIDLKLELEKYCSSVAVNKKINFDNMSGLFYAWTGTKKG